jgi:DNA-binding protein WhiA
LLAETAALLSALAEYTTPRLLLATEHELVARRFQYLLRQLFATEGTYGKRGHQHTVVVEGEGEAARILHATGCQALAERYVDPLAVMGNCCKRAYIRGSFIASGTLSDPHKTYHLEFSLPTPAGRRMAERLITILRGFGLHPRIHDRKSHALVYVKEAEEIVDILNIMAAYKSLLELENVRIFKEVRNSVNRHVNFETANLHKIVDASVKQIEDIRFIAGQVGLGCLSAPLEEVALLRMEYEDASLKEIGGMLKPPVSKSGVNHRLRKISEMAEHLRERLQA